MFGWAKRNPQAPGLESAEGRYGLEYHTRSPFAIRKRQAGTGAENAHTHVGILRRVHSLSDYRARIPKEASRPARALMQRAAHYAGQRIDVQVFRVLISPLCVPFTSAPDIAHGAEGLCVSIFFPTYILHFNPLPQGLQGVRDEMSCLQVKSTLQNSDGRY